MLLEKHKKLAIQAWSGISFSPKKRADSCIKDYSNELSEALKLFDNQQAKELFQSGYEKRFIAWLNSRTGIYSVMISGGSNFPVRRMEKLNRWSDNRYKEFREWVDKTIKRQQQPVYKKPCYLTSIRENLAFLAQIRGGCTDFNSALFKSSIKGFLKTIAKQKDIELLTTCINEIEKQNNEYKKPLMVLTEVFLAGVTELAHVKEPERFTNDYSFKYGKISVNWKAERVQLLFNEKPDEVMRGTLKQNGFKWSSKNEAWQRFITLGTRSTIKQLFNIQIEV